MGLPAGSLPEIIIVYKSLTENGGRYFYTVYTREYVQRVKSDTNMEFTENSILERGDKNDYKLCKTVNMYWVLIFVTGTVLRILHPISQYLKIEIGTIIPPPFFFTDKETKVYKGWVGYSQSDR